MSYRQLFDIFNRFDVFGAGGGSLTYLLHTLFSGATPIDTFTEGQTLDTPAEGLLVNTLTVDRQSNFVGWVGIESSKLRTTGNDPASYNRVYSPNNVPIANGMVVVFENFSTAGGFDSQSIMRLLVTSDVGELARLQVQGTTNSLSLGGVSIGTISSSTPYSLAVVFNTNSDLVFYYLKGGVYTDWTLLYTTTFSGLATLIGIDAGAKYCIGNTLYGDFRIPETPFPELVAFDIEDSFTEASGTVLLSNHTSEDGVAWQLSADPFRTGIPEVTAATNSVQTPVNGTIIYKALTTNKQYLKGVALTANLGQYIYLRTSQAQLDDYLTGNAVIIIADNLNNGQVREKVNGTQFQRVSSFAIGAGPHTLEGYIDGTTLRYVIDGTNYSVAMDGNASGDGLFAGIELNAVYTPFASCVAKELDGHTIEV